MRRLTEREQALVVSLPVPTVPPELLKVWAEEVRRLVGASRESASAAVTPAAPKAKVKAPAHVAEQFPLPLEAILPVMPTEPGVVDAGVTEEQLPKTAMEKPAAKRRVSAEKPAADPSAPAKKKRKSTPWDGKSKPLPAQLAATYTHREKLRKAWQKATDDFSKACEEQKTNPSDDLDKRVLELREECDAIQRAQTKNAAKCAAMEKFL
jgi:hypothetical protein